MDRKKLALLFFVIGAVAMLVLSQSSVAEKSKLFIPDKALCAKMLAFGKQSYQRGKYLDAKEYFRKAVRADPMSAKAWSWYDLAAVFALAEKVEQNADMIAPGVSARQEAAGTPAPVGTPPAPLQKPEKKKFEFKIVDDEGC
jgi:hypothetical protein